MVAKNDPPSPIDDEANGTNNYCGIAWDWTGILCAFCDRESGDATPRLLLIAPTFEGLTAFLEDGQATRTVWLVLPSRKTSSLKSMEVVDRITLWDAQSVTGEPVIVLECRSGAKFAVGPSGCTNWAPTGVIWSCASERSSLAPGSWTILRERIPSHDEAFRNFQYDDRDAA